MKLIRIFLPLCCLALLAGAGTYTGAAQEGEKLVWADFEAQKDGRPVSNRGGVVQLFSYQENGGRPSRFKGLAASDPPAPEPVRLKKDDPNQAVAFEYELQGLNEYAGVGVEVRGQADRDGKPVADDVSNYKFLTLQVYATGVPALRLEFISKGNGIEMASGYPQMTFKVTPGFNTYKIPLKSVAQPSWAQEKVSTKDVLKKLTSVNLSAFCDKCMPTKGTVVIDNITFHN